MKINLAEPNAYPKTINDMPKPKQYPQMVLTLGAKTNALAEKLKSVGVAVIEYELVSVSKDDDYSPGQTTVRLKVKSFEPKEEEISETYNPVTADEALQKFMRDQPKKK